MQPSSVPPRSPSSPSPGLRIARGVCRHLDGLGFVCLEEFTPSSGLRLDVMALGPKGEFWVIECKSGPADFRADRKWQNYLQWGDRFFWAVQPGFPRAMLPEGCGLILADDFAAELVAMPEATPLAPARRRALLHKFARIAARRLQALRDPGLSAFSMAQASDLASSPVLSPLPQSSRS